VQPGIFPLYVPGELCEPRQQYPEACVYVYKEGDAPMIDPDILLFDPQETNIGIIRNIIDGYPGH
jgi:hypothetical protein